MTAWRYLLVLCAIQCALGARNFKNPKPKAGTNCMRGATTSRLSDQAYKQAEGGPVVFPKQLTCTADKCPCWRNHPKSDIADRPFMRITGDSSKCYAGGKQGSYIGVISPKKPADVDRMVLDSCAVLCTGSKVRVDAKFDYSQDHVVVGICKQQSFSDKAEPYDCQKAEGDQPVFLNGGDVFDIVLVVQLVSGLANNPTFLLKSIVVDFEPCELTTVGAATNPPRPQGPTNLCGKAACRFDTDTCGWQQTGKGSKWQRYLGHEVAGNEDTGVNALLLQKKYKYPKVSDRPYYGVRLNPKDRVALEVFDVVTGGRPVKIVMDVYEACDQAVITVCTDSDCRPITNSNVNKKDRAWRTVKMDIDKNTQRMAIIADNSGSNFFCAAGIMDVNFIDDTGRKLCRV